MNKRLTKKDRKRREERARNKVLESTPVRGAVKNGDATVNKAGYPVYTCKICRCTTMETYCLLGC